MKRQKSIDGLKRSDIYSNGFGARASIGVDYKIGGVVDVFAQAVVDWFSVPKQDSFKKSDILYAGIEVGVGF